MPNNIYTIKQTPTINNASITLSTRIETSFSIIKLSYVSCILAMLEFGVMAFFIHGNPRTQAEILFDYFRLYSNQEPKIMCLHKHLFSVITETGKRQNSLLAFLLLSFCFIIPGQANSTEIEPGISDTHIRIGAIMPLTGDNQYYGIGMKKGIDAALANQVVQGRKIEFKAMDDSGDSVTTIQVANQIIDEGIFLMLGNVGALPTLQLLPVLRVNQIPSIGFYTLGDVSNKDTLNYRPNTSSLSDLEPDLTRGVE